MRRGRGDIDWIDQVKEYSLAARIQSDLGQEETLLYVLKSILSKTLQITVSARDYGGQSWIDQSKGEKDIQARGGEINGRGFVSYRNHRISIRLPMETSLRREQERKRQYANSGTYKIISQQGMH